MSVVAVLSVLFDAKTDKLEKGLDRAAQKSQELGDSLSIDDLRGFAGELAGIAGVSMSLDAAFSQLAGAFEKLDGLSKSSQKLGIASQELAGLQHAAGMAGVEGGELDKALAKLGTNTLKAANGSAQAANGFRLLGINAANIANKPLEEQFFAVAEAMASTEDQTNKLAAAQAIFGDAGVALLPLLMQGKDAIREQADEAARLGIAFNNIELKNIEAANDGFTRLSTAVDGLTGQLAVKLAPVAASVLESMANALAVSNQTLEQQAKSLDDQTSGWNSLTLALANVADGFGFVYEAMRLVAMLWTGLNTALIVGIKGISEVLSDMAKKLSGDRLGLDWVAENIQKRIDLNAKWMDEQEKAAKAYWEGSFGVTHFEKSLQSLRKQAQELRKVGDTAMRPAIGAEGGFGAGGDGGRMAAPGALEFGSREAFSAINAAGGDAGTMIDQQKLTVKGIQSMTERLIEQRQELMRIGRWIEGLGQNAKQVKL